MTYLKIVYFACWPFCITSVLILACLFSKVTIYPANNNLLKVNNRNARKECEICSKLTIKTPERRH